MYEYLLVALWSTLVYSVEVPGRPRDSLLFFGRLPLIVAVLAGHLVTGLGYNPAMI